MSEVLFYERPVPLNRESHKDLRIKPMADMSFTAKTHSVPLASIEFPSAAHHYPILFGGNSVEDANPIALLGVRQHENLMVNEDGLWDRSTYIPAFVRRYPFVLAEKSEDGEGDDFAVFLDESYEGFNNEEGERLFNEDGSDTDTLKQAVGFLGEFQQHINRTKAFMKRVRELDLLVARNIEIKMPDKNTVLNGLFVIDEEKLHKLDAETIHGLLQDGSLGWIHAHLFSLSNLDGIIQRLHARFTPEERQRFVERMREETVENA
ncbi:hypothetical protein HNQ86_002847 [Oleiagrimonas soli]|uniref:Multidrug transporter n=1 Tax=Oleiagrimonas soli TaxID=1543381 RepID=A0A841KK24_9GAMM|nr:SapC family protein [Oleiagrimonas soli]MBB6185502.1 hypothetical protein [Oleiagrimonas soli]